MLELGMYVLIYLEVCTIFTTLAGMRAFSVCRVRVHQRLRLRASACVCYVCVALSFLKKNPTL